MQTYLKYFYFSSIGLNLKNYILFPRIFEKCHDIIPYEIYIDGCEFDVCHTRNITVGCAALQSYAQQCALNGICVDWRGATDGVCGKISTYIYTNVIF